MAEKRSSIRHSAFFDLEKSPERDSLTRPQSMLRSTEWGGLTLVSLLAGLAFPPYFVSVMALAFFNAGGMLWVSHLNDEGRKRLREFEREFAQGHALEESGDHRAAADFYAGLIGRYQDYPRISQIAEHQLEQLRQAHPALLTSLPKPAKTAPAAGNGQKSSRPAARATARTGKASNKPAAAEGLRLNLKRKPA